MKNTDNVLNVKKLKEGEIDLLTIDELVELKASIEPLYTFRREILTKYGIEEWSKVIIYPFLLSKIREMKIK